MMKNAFNNVIIKNNFRNSKILRKHYEVIHLKKLFFNSHLKLAATCVIQCSM